jgi:hypothetical protein
VRARAREKHHGCDALTGEGMAGAALAGWRLFGQPQAPVISIT